MAKELASDSNVSHYRIVSKIGAGGMGEVYRAYDARLNREVAIKFLPADFANDEDRLRRFEQEARATSALNHPNILTVYDIGAHEDLPFIVAELLDGEELRERLNDGAISQRKAIEYAQQIVAGLAAAHEKGIVHRDLKPENIFITTDDRVKILDFGLAKLKPAKVAAGAGSEVATQRALTDPGAVMGTVGYMSPEQIRGKDLDHRSDIFSFGVILYEMLSGRRTFTGESAIEVMNGILKDEPQELAETNAKISPGLEKIVRRCLEKKPERRFQSTSDLGFALEALSAPSSSSGNQLTTTANALIEGKAKPSAWRGWLAWAVAGALALALLTLGALYLANRAARETHAVRLSFSPPPELAFNDTQPDAAVISPDGQKISFSATSPDGKTMLYVRNLDSDEVKQLPGSGNPLEPFWSPDSRSIAYGSNGKLKRSDLTGASAQVLCDSARLVGGTWSKDGIIVFAPDYDKQLMQVSAQGGEPKPVTMNIEDSETSRYAYFLPDGRHFIFPRGLRGIWAGSLDSPEIKQIVAGRGAALYAPPGWLIFLRNDALMAQAFDTGKLSVSGEPIPIITDQKTPANARRFSVSDNGILIWQGLWQRDYQLVWYDREGKQTGAIDAPMKVSVGQSPMLSADGKRLAVRRVMGSGGAGADSNIWVVDLEKGTGLRITSTFSQMPVWSPDGSRILYNSGNSIAVKAANGSGDPETLLPRTAFTAAWSPDGRFIIFMERGVKTRMDLWALPLFGDRKEYRLSNSPFDEQNPSLSPDGHWLAYSSDETGNYEIYVQSFSAAGKLGADKKIVSTAGGKLPVWRRDASELFYIAADGQMMASSVKTGGTEFQFDAPKPLFKTRTMGLESAIFREFDVSPDGQRFLIGSLIGDSKAAPPTAITNWTALLKK